MTSPEPHSQRPYSGSPSDDFSFDSTLPSTAAGELWDSVIIGGGASGLAAAQALGRSLRRTLVIDAGSPRNRFAEHMHTVLGHDGLAPAELLRTGRAEAARYGVIFHSGRVRHVRESSTEASAAASAASPIRPRALSVTLEDGQQLSARTVIAATGVSDQLPEIPGLARRWGRSVLHCPYCHGWEVRGQRLGVLATSELGLHQAELLRQWSDQLTFFSAGAGELDAATAARLESRGVTIEPTPVAELLGEGEALSAVTLEDGRRIGVDALFTAAELVPQEDFLSALDLDRSETMGGSFIAADQNGRTSHDRAWAPGNLSSPMANVPMAVSAGTMAGAMANMTLVSEDFDLAQEVGR